MDPRFVATPTDDAIFQALQLWPQLAGKTYRPLLVTAFGDIFIEERSGKVSLVDSLELAVQEIARNTDELSSLFSNPDWAHEKLLTQVVLAAEEAKRTRKPEQVFAVAPHPALGGRIVPERLLAMDLLVWHHICAQIRPK